MTISVTDSLCYEEGRGRGLGRGEQVGSSPGSGKDPRHLGRPTSGSIDRDDTEVTVRGGTVWFLLLDPHVRSLLFQPGNK